MARERIGQKRRQSFNPKTAKYDDTGVITSAKKLKSQEEFHVSTDHSINYRVINSFTVYATISNLVKCARCNGSV